MPTPLEPASTVFVAVARWSFFRSTPPPSFPSSQNGRECRWTVVKVLVRVRRELGAGLEQDAAAVPSSPTMRPDMHWPPLSDAIADNTSGRLPQTRVLAESPTLISRSSRTTTNSSEGIWSGFAFPGFGGLASEELPCGNATGKKRSAKTSPHRRRAIRAAEADTTSCREPCRLQRMMRKCSGDEMVSVRTLRISGLKVESSPCSCGAPVREGRAFILLYT